MTIAVVLNFFDHIYLKLFCFHILFHFLQYKTDRSKAASL